MAGKMQHRLTTTTHAQGPWRACTLAAGPHYHLLAGSATQASQI